MCETPAVALHSYPDSKAFRVECEACNVNGPLLTTAEQAIESWNNRPNTITSEELKAAAEKIHAANGRVRAAVSLDWVCGSTPPGAHFTATSGYACEITKWADTLDEAVNRVIEKIGTTETRRAAELAKLKQAMSEHGITAEELKG
jgi:hypothetical protein